MGLVETNLAGTPSLFVIAATVSTEHEIGEERLVGQEGMSQRVPCQRAEGAVPIPCAGWFGKRARNNQTHPEPGTSGCLVCALTYVCFTDRAVSVR